MHWELYVISVCTKDQCTVKRKERILFFAKLRWINHEVSRRTNWWENSTHSLKTQQTLKEITFKYHRTIKQEYSTEYIMT